jgi:D-alanyl-D-alanine carboxypeptidase-like protein
MRRLGVGVLVLLLTACASAGAATREQPPAPLRTMPIDPTPSSNPTPSPTASPRSHLQLTPLRFHGSISKLPPALAARMRGTTWHPGCPVPLSHLRLLRLSYWDFRGDLRVGPMVVNQSVAKKIVSVFRKLFWAHFPIHEMHLTRKYVASKADPNDTSDWTDAFNCRVTVTALGPGTNWSNHAYGLAVDVNPMQNPYVTASGFIFDVHARRYRDRSQHLQGMIHPGGVVVRAFRSIGWGWGGTWTGDKDYMHFSWNGH